MNITQERVGEKTVMYMEGRFDFASRKVFKDAIDLAAGEGSPVVLELEKVIFVDSSALGLLVICHQNFKNKKIPFFLVNPQTYVKQVLDLANIAKMIPIFQTLAEVPNGSAVPAGTPA